MNKIIVLLSLLLSSPCWATTYFLANASTSPVGNDSNNGLSAGAPWLTPNHALNCGDTIVAAASAAYNRTNFTAGEWGTVTCAAGNNVAWLTCAVFDACKITAASFGGPWISSSYWGIQGWEVSTTGATDGACFTAEPNFGAVANIHHIVFADNICNGAFGSGFFTFPNGSFGVDYLAIVGNISYNAAQGSSECWSGINIVAPISTDSLPGTHIYVAGNFTWGNINPNPCAGMTPTDGEGVTLDSFDVNSYAQQSVVANNIALGNGASAVKVTGATKARVYVYGNTAYGNNVSTNASDAECGEFVSQNSANTEYYRNLVRTATTNGCGANPIYLFFMVASPLTGDVVYQNFGYSSVGNNTQPSSGFTFGPNNTFGTDPLFAGAAVPGAPSCGSFASVPACMASVIANFVPTVSVAKAYGFQQPTSSSAYDPMYPQWLCTTSLPSGLVTPGCVTGSVMR